MKTWHCWIVLCAACGTEPVGDDTETPPPPPGDLSPLCAQGESVVELWSADNRHGPVTSIDASSNLIVLGSEDGSVKQWSFDGDEPGYGQPFATSGAPVVAVGSDPYRGDVLAATRTGDVLAWSLFTALTGAATGLASLVVYRFLFGVGEAGAYPSMARVQSRWLPKLERAQAGGILWLCARSGAPPPGRPQGPVLLRS